MTERGEGRQRKNFSRTQALARAAGLLESADDDQKRAYALLDTSARKIDEARNLLQVVVLVSAYRRRRSAGPPPGARR